MKNKHIDVSIVIVNYKVEKELFNCVDSIINLKPKAKYEIIVIDNYEESKIENEIKNKFPKIKYIKSSKNIGFGAGNNLGAKTASGKFLFFLNPDTTVEDYSIDVLLDFAKCNPKSGMVAPLLFDSSGHVYPSQGSDEYNLKNAVVTLSFVNKIFSNNIVSTIFFHKNWNKKNAEEFDVVPGTAFMIRKDLFEKAGMFDENFFLYFEEYDLAKRIKKLGYKNYIVPKAKVIHAWGASTKKRKDIKKIFSESRFLFFKKHYGILFALIIEIISRFGKYEFALGSIVFLSIFLGMLRINELMPFIGDQAWFYLSARDALLSGQIPLVGIASSHPWLHQGPFWTYLLIPFLWLFNFDPISGAYLTVILGILSVVGIYVVGSALFSKRVGLIASLLYATSPLAVYHMRFPYHTSPIPLFVMILTLFLYKIIQRKFNYLPMAIFVLAVLYNFEIATSALWGVLAVILAYRIIKNKKDLRNISNKKNIMLSFLFLVISLLPMILYDVRNGFPQTLKFAAWVIYRVVSLFGYNPQQTFSINKIYVMFDFLFVNFTRLIFAQSSFVSFLLIALLAAWVIHIILKKTREVSHILIFMLVFIPLIIIVFNQTPSDAYLPIFFPSLILLFALFLNFIAAKKIMLVSVFIFIIILTAGNINFMLRNNFMFNKSSELFALERRFRAAYRILNIVQGKDYNLKGRGAGSEFENFTKNYEYLTWFLGHAPSKKDKSLKVYVSDLNTGINVETEQND